MQGVGKRCIDNGAAGKNIAPDKRLILKFFSVSQRKFFFDDLAAELNIHQNRCPFFAFINTFDGYET